jgi:uncharacterized repeat protein (TIGR03803 family)
MKGLFFQRMCSKARCAAAQAGCLLLFAGNIFGQPSYSVMHTFTNGTDGAQPKGGLAYDGFFLFGTTFSGGTNNNGTLFRIRPDGNDYATLIDLTTGTGKNPTGSPTTNGTSLNFTSIAGGTFGNGTMVSINTPGTTNGSYTYTGRSFATSEGIQCNGSLVLNSGTLYGTMFGLPVPAAPPGGDNVFRIQPTGSSFSIVTNLTGQNPVGGLAAGSGVLYGATWHGGNGSGSIFRIDLATTGYSVIKIFTNVDGATPNGDLLLDGTNLFGTTVQGGAAGNGTIFRLNTNGTEYVVLKDFPATSGGGTNSDGASPNGGLVTDGKTLFGTTQHGGSSGIGTVFRIDMDGSNFEVVKDFSKPPGALTTNLDGAYPNGSMLLVRGKLYGTTSIGGASGKGVVFRLVIPPDIQIGDTNFGVTSNRFGFNITGISNQTIAVDVSSNMVNWSQLFPNT